MNGALRSRLRYLCCISLFACSNFLVLLACMAATALGAMLLIRAGLLTPDFYLHPLSALNFAFVAGVVISVISALIVSRLLRRSLRIPLEAMRQMARGRFDVRVDFGRLPLLREADEFAVAFNEMAKELAGMEMMRADFINDFSHEFQLPVASLKGFAQQLLKSDLTTEQRREYASVIVGETERLSHLAADILSLGRVEHQTIVSGKTAYNLAEQIRQSVLLLEGKWMAKALEPDLELQELTITANASLLAQVWDNLLDNAVKFSPEEGTLSVRLFRDGGRAVVEVRNDGPGMEPETLRRVFDKFYQGDASRATPGNGLGLALVKKIVELHCGTIQAQSVPRQGAMFVVSLPLEG